MREAVEGEVLDNELVEDKVDVRQRRLGLRRTGDDLEELSAELAAEGAEHAAVFQRRVQHLRELIRRSARVRVGHQVCAEGPGQSGQVGEWGSWRAGAKRRETR